MATGPLDESDFTTRLARAIRSYESGWKLVDGELYDLCGRRSSHHDFEDVYAKAVIIGRVYEAGVARAWRGEGDPETEVTHVLIEHADLIETHLRNLGNCSFNRRRAAEVVELHGHVARAISHRTAGIFLTSFVSKYLHFHCPIVPIFDTNAQAAIGQYIDWKLATATRGAMANLPEFARAYRNFVAAFVILHERAHAETPLKPTVKELDHLLWQPT